MVARQEGVGELGEKGKGLRSTNWQLQNNHAKVKYGTRNIVNNIVITMYGARFIGVITYKLYKCLITGLCT